MKKTIVAIMLIFSLFSSASFASPLVLLAPGVAIAIASAATGVYYGLNPGAIPYVDVGANIKRAATAVYAHMSGGSPVLSTIAVDAKLTMAQLTALASSKPGTYPLLYGSLSTPVDTSATGSTAVGATMWNQALGHNVTVTRVDVSTAPNNTWVPGTYYFDTYVEWRSNNDAYAGGQIRKQYAHDSGTAPTPPPVSSTPSQIQQKITGSAPGVPAPALSTYADEIDRMLQDPDYVPVFSDSTTGLPFSPPPNILTSAEISAYNSADATKSALFTAYQAADSAATQSAMTLSVAQVMLSTAQTARANLSANATPAEIAAADKAVADAGSAMWAAQNASGVANVSKANANAAYIAASGAVVPDVVPLAPATVLPARPALKTVSFAPLIALNGVLSTTYPFNLPSSITSYFAAFSGAGAAPVFDLPLPLGQSIHVDLAFFDPIAVMIRYMIGILITCGMLFSLSSVRI